MMINTSSTGAAQGATGHLASSDAEKLQLQEMVQDYLNHQES